MATIQGVYVALFGRPADPTGLAYFNSVTQNGADLTAIGDLSSTQEYKDRFDGQNNAQIVTSIYQSLFNRDPEAAGLNFFVNALNTGALNINNIAIAILDGAQGTDLAIVNAKVASANLFTAEIDTPLEIASYSGNDAAALGRAFLADVGATAKTQAQAAAAVQGVVDAGNTGNTIELAGLTEVVVGNVGQDDVSTSRNDTINATTAGDWVATQRIDGGFGVDTLNATLDADLTVDDGVGTNGFLRNVEILNITAETNAVTLNLENAVGVQQAWNVESTSALTIAGLSTSTAIGLEGTIGGAAAFEFEDVDGSSDAVTLVVDDAVVAAGVTIDDIETLTISATGSSDLGALTAADLVSITVVGGGDLTVDLSGVITLESFVGGAGVEVIEIDATALSEALVVDLGAGNDIITIDLNGAVVAPVDITGGAGSDLFEIGALANVAVATEDDFADSLVTITDFNAAQDVIDVTLGATDATFNNVQLSNIANAASLFDAVTLVSNISDAQGATQALFVYGSDTYIFSDNVAGGGLQVGDGLVKIQGLTDLSLLTDANFI